ncbi:DUF3244 domain-containing protein [uncultured Methanobrevibacter sp.]|uniref:DUF3244 domain-containing protein n=1 Tax=uncultured Methanobrevibacter sp. TaxID=253161 RepID=UPI0025D0448A|nr:hypothetical protein [uncultured Methanobrevibacter sp.]
MDNKILRDLLIFGIIIIIAAIVFSFVFSPSSDAHNTSIQVLNKGDLGSNSTIYVKLTDSQKTSLSNKTVHVKLLDNKGKVVYKKNIKTHATGVGMAKLSNMSSGEYTLNITYDGDANYTGCSLSKKVKVDSGVVKDEIDNSTLDSAAIQDILDTQAQLDQDSSDSQQYDQSYTPSNPSSDSDSSSSDSNDDGFDVYIDEDGNTMDVVIDEDGNQVDPTQN